MVLELMQRLGVESVKRVAKVGDSVRDIEEGFAAGCGLVVGVLSGADDRKTLESAGAHLVVNDVTELVVVDDMKDADKPAMAVEKENPGKKTAAAEAEAAAAMAMKEGALVQVLLPPSELLSGKAAPSTFDLRRVAVPSKGALVQMLGATICASDVHSKLGRRSAAVAKEDSLRGKADKRKVPAACALGHEGIGVLLRTSDGLVAADDGEAPLPGDIITWGIAASRCHQHGTVGSACERCDAGIPQKCVNLLKYGHEPFFVEDGGDEPEMESEESKREHECCRRLSGYVFFE